MNAPELLLADSSFYIAAFKAKKLPFDILADEVLRL